MGYDRQVSEMARAELERRRQRAEYAANENLERFYRECPRAREVKSQMAANAAGAARAVVGGGDVRAELEKLRDKGLALSREYERLLASAGLAPEDVAPRYTCPACRDTGFVDGRMCQCLKRLRRSIAYRQLSSDLPLEKCRFENFSLEYYAASDRAYHQMEGVLRACRKYAQSFRADSPSMLFKGGTGLGKTHLSLAIANRALEKGFGVVYGTAQSFTAAFERERFQREEGSTAETLKECDLLIVDDLGAEGGTAYVYAVLYDVLNSRMMGDRPTVISTNLDLKGMEKQYGERFASRIGGYYAKMEFKGEDVRVLKRTRRGSPGNPPGKRGDPAP